MEDLSFIALKPSRIARNLHVVLALLALLALCLSGVESIWKVLLTLLLLWAAVWQWRRDQSVPVKGLSCKSGRWYLLIDDREYQGELCGEQRVLSWWVMLQWREDAMQKKTQKKRCWFCGQTAPIQKTCDVYGCFCVMVRLTHQRSDAGKIFWNQHAVFCLW